MLRPGRCKIFQPIRAPRVTVRPPANTERQMLERRLAQLSCLAGLQWNLMRSAATLELPSHGSLEAAPWDVERDDGSEVD